jgi:hypothetical protein
MKVLCGLHNLNEKDGSPYSWWTVSLNMERISGEHLAVLLSLFWARSLTQPKWLPSLFLSYSSCVADLSFTYGEQGGEDRSMLGRQQKRKIIFISAFN